MGRWLKWSQDKLNALDKSTAEALPAVERDVKRRVGRVALAITQEYVHQFPPLEVYLADRAFEMDEMRNAAIRAKLAERDAKATSGANENQTEDAREKDEDEPASPEPTEAKTEPESRAPETTPSTASKQPSASKNARRKLTDFFFAGGHAAAVQAATDAREETKMVPTKISPTKISPTKEPAANATVAAGGSARDESRARGALGARGCRARGVVGGAETDEASVVVARASIETHRRERASTSDGSRFGYESARVESSARVPGFRGGGDGARGGGVVDRGGGAGAPADDDARRALGGDDGAARARRRGSQDRPRRFSTSGPRVRSSQRSRRGGRCGRRGAANGTRGETRREEARRTAQKTARVRVAGDEACRGTPSKMRGCTPRRVERGRRREWRRGREGTVRGYVESSSVGRAVDGEGAERTGGGDVRRRGGVSSAGASTGAGGRRCGWRAW